MTSNHVSLISAFKMTFRMTFRMTFMMTFRMTFRTRHFRPFLPVFGTKVLKYQKVKGFDLGTHIPWTNEVSWVEKYWPHALANSKNIISVQRTCASPNPSPKNPPNTKVDLSNSFYFNSTFCSLLIYTLQSRSSGSLRTDLFWMMRAVMGRKGRRSMWTWHYNDHEMF